VYCLFGENACGKTQFLENLVKTFFSRSTLFFNIIGDISNEKSKYRYLNKFHELGNFAFNDKIKMPARVALNADDVNTSYGSSNLYLSNFSHAASSSTMIDCPIVYISAKERGYTKNVSKDNVKLLGDDLEVFSEALKRTLHKLTENKELFEYQESHVLAHWISTRLLINPDFAPENKLRFNEVEALVDLLCLLEPTLEKEVTNLAGKLKSFSYRQGKLYFLGQPIDTLSTGYVSVLKIFQEIIASYGAWLGVAEEDDIRNSAGIVCIDEIEAHLHAKWQYKIIPLLKQFFPNTVFYITTHSPLIVSTTQADEAYELVRNEQEVHTRKLGNPQDWYLADVFSQAFHIDFSIQNEVEAESLPEKLKLFGSKVRAYTLKHDNALRKEIETLYENLLPSLPETDPRRRSLDRLKSLVQ
jgi:hypothetical protein